MNIGVTEVSEKMQNNIYPNIFSAQGTLMGAEQRKPPAMVDAASNCCQNLKVSGPPTQGLFDSLQNNRTRAGRKFVGQNCVFTSPMSCPTSVFNIPLGTNDAIQVIESVKPTDFNKPRDFLKSPKSRLWVTVYGFPPSDTLGVLSHFSQCGTILNKVFPQKGNWVHLKYSSALEANKALLYNQKIFHGNMMIGVTRCKNANVLDGDKLDQNKTSTFQDPTGAIHRSDTNNPDKEKLEQNKA